MSGKCFAISLSAAIYNKVKNIGYWLEGSTSTILQTFIFDFVEPCNKTGGMAGKNVLPVVLTRWGK